MANARFEVEIYGDTTKFESSLKGVKQAMSSLKGEGNLLKKALDLDPTNTEKMRAYQKNLQEQLRVSSMKAQQLKKDIANIDKDDPKNSKKWADLNRQLGQATAESTKLETELDKVENAISTGNWKAKPELDTSNVENSVSKTKKSFSALKEIAVGALRSIGSSITGAIGNGLRGWVADAMTTQKAMISLKNTMEFKGNAKEFDYVKNSMSKLATATNANTEDTLKLSTTFIGLGDDAKTAVSKTSALVKANQAFGGTGEQLKGVVQAYGQMSAAGKVTAENINQLTDNNTALGSALKSTVMEMNPALKQYGSFAGASEKGAISVEMLDKAMQKLGKAGGNSITTIGDAWDAFNETMSLALLPTLEALTPVITAIIDKMSGWGEIAGSAISGIVQYVQLLWYELQDNGALKAFGSVWDSLKSIVGSVLTIFVQLVQAFFKVDDATVKNATSMNSVAETIKKVASALQTVTGKIAEFLTKLKNNQTAMDVLKGSIVAISVAMTAFKVGKGIMTAIAMYQKLSAVLKAGKGIMVAFNVVAGMNPYVLIAGAIIAVVAGLTYFFAKTKTGQKIWADFVNFLKDSVENIKNFFSGLGDWFGNLWDGIVNYVKGVGQGIADSWNESVESIKSIWSGITGFFSGLVQGIVNIWNGITDFFANLWTTITGGIQTAWNGVIEFIKTVVNWFMTTFQPLIAFYQSIFNLIISIINLAWQTVLLGVRAVVAGIQAIWSGILAFFTPIFNAIVTVAQNAWNGIVSAFQTMANIMENVIDAVSIFVGNVFNSIVNFLRPIFNTIANIAQNAFNSVMSFAQNAWNVIRSVWSAVAGFFSGVFNSVRNIVSSAFSAIGNFANSAMSRIRGVFSSIGSFFSGVFNGARNAVSNVFNQFGSFASNAVRAITGAFGGLVSFFSNIFGSIGRIVDNVLGGVTRTIDGITSAVNGVAGKISKLLNSNIVHTLPDVNLAPSGQLMNSTSVNSTNNSNVFNIQGGNNDATAIARQVVRLMETGRA